DVRRDRGSPTRQRGQSALAGASGFPKSLAGASGFHDPALEREPPNDRQRGHEMIGKLIRVAMDYRLLVVAATAAICVFGVWSFTQQPIDAYPDISSQMVTVIATYPGRAPEEVERQVIIPLEIALRGVPRATTIRSRAIFGLAVVQVSFEE